MELLTFHHTPGNLHLSNWLNNCMAGGSRNPRRFARQPISRCENTYICTTMICTVRPAVTDHQASSRFFFVREIPCKAYNASRQEELGARSPPGGYEDSYQEVRTSSTGSECHYHANHTYFAVSQEEALACKGDHHSEQHLVSPMQLY